jgi:hypothetical protein
MRERAAQEARKEDEETRRYIQQAAATSPASWPTSVTAASSPNRSSSGRRQRSWPDAIPPGTAGRPDTRLAPGRPWTSIIRRLMPLSWLVPRSAPSGWSLISTGHSVWAIPIVVRRADGSIARRKEYRPNARGKRREHVSGSRPGGMIPAPAQAAPIGVPTAVPSGQPACVSGRSGSPPARSTAEPSIVISTSSVPTPKLTTTKPAATSTARRQSHER